MTASLSTSTPSRLGPPAVAPHMSGLPGLVADGDRHADQRAVLGPRTVVVLHVRLVEDLVQHEPGVRGALADPAVRDGVLRRSRRRPRRTACVSSSSDRNVPSSLAALLHGMLTAVGTWPARCDCSCGRCAGASSRPANSSGERTSTRFLAPMAATTSSRKARMSRFWLLRGVRRRRRASATSSVSSRESSSHFLRPPSSSSAVVVAVELEVPVGVGGEPVVVAAVQHDRVVVADAALRTAAPRTAPC